MKNGYIVICQQIVGGNGTPFETCYNFDGKVFSSRKQAIKHGFKIRESDDFNIGVVKDGKLISFDWMEKQLEYDLEEVAEYIGIRS